MNHIKNYWEKLTVEANKLFEKAEYFEAKEVYMNALYRAEVLNNNMDSCIESGIPFVQIYIVSCNNLASTYQAIGEIERANKILRKTLFFLLYIARENVIDLDEIQSEMRKAIINYTQFLNENKLDKSQQVHLFDSIKGALVRDELVVC